MSIVLLLSTTALAMGFLWLIDLSYLAYIPLVICVGIIIYSVRSLYRDSVWWKSKALPYLQEQSIWRVIMITILRFLEQQFNPNRNFLSVFGLMLYAGLIIRGTVSKQNAFVRQGLFGYVCTTVVAMIASRRGITSLTIITRLIIIHWMIGMTLAHRRRWTHTKRAETLYKNIIYLAYTSVICLGFVYLPQNIAALIVTIIIGSLIISIPHETVEVTPTKKMITAEAILRGESVLQHKEYDAPSRHERMGIQPSHSTILIRTVIFILSVSIINQINNRYIQGKPAIRETIVFIATTIISVIVCVKHYISHRRSEKFSLRKIVTIFITNIAIGISIVHLFYPQTWLIISGAIIRNTLNNATIRGLRRSRKYRRILHGLEYKYRARANITIAIINSILITTRFQASSRQITATLIVIYLATQGIFLHPLYRSIQKSKA